MEVTDTYFKEFSKLISDISAESQLIGVELIAGKFPTAGELMDRALVYITTEIDGYFDILTFFLAVILFAAVMNEINENLAIPVNITAGAVIVFTVLDFGFFGENGFFDGLSTVALFVKSFVPIFAVVLAMCGNITMSGVYGTAALFCIEIFSKINTDFLTDFINLLISVGVIAGMGGGERYETVFDTVRKVIIGCQCAMASIILAVMSLNGFAAQGTDSLIFKTGKTLSGAAIPVIGSTISSGYDTVTACFSAATGVMGAAAMFVLIILAAPKLLEIFVFVTVMWISETVGDFFSCTEVSRVFSAFKTAGILILSAYIFELLVLVMGIAIMLMIRN